LKIVSGDETIKVDISHSRLELNKMETYVESSTTFLVLDSYSAINK